MRKELKPILIFLLSAVACTLLIYWIDDDPPYDDVWHTVQEFLFSTAFFFAVIALIYYSFLSFLDFVRRR